MEQFVSTYGTILLNGLAYSLLLFMLATGLSLIFGMMEFINLAHGSFYMLGGYVALSVIRWTDNFWLALLLAPLAIALLGLAMEVTLLRNLYKRGHLDQVLLTFGFALIFDDVRKMVWGPDVLSLPAPEFLSTSVEIFGGFFPVYRIFLVVFGLALAGILYLLMERSRLGAIVRAGVADPEMVSGLGINVTLVFTLVFAFGAFLAALAGVVAGPILSLYPGVDFQVLIIALIVVVVGGLGTFRGAFFGALLVGMAETFGRTYFPQFALFLVFGIMAAVLLLKPSGLFGRETA